MISFPTDIKIGVTAKLMSLKDWRNWEHTFRLQIKNYDLDDVVFGSRQLMRRPIEPDIRNTRYTKTAAALLKAEPQAEDAPNQIIQNKQNREWIITDLTANDQTAFSVDYNYYKAKKSDYDSRKINLEKLRKFVLAIINPDYVITCCQSENLMGQ
jgi:hypothetical protein